MTLNDKEQILKLQHHFTLNNDEYDKKYMQNIIVLDTETSTCYAEKIDKKIAFAYKFLFIIDGIYLELDTPQAFIKVLQFITDINDTEKQFKIFVHNLGYDFIFLKNLFQKNGDYMDCKVFARKKNDYCKITINDKIEFCDTLALKNCSLSTWAKELGLKKMTGDLDYSKVRTYSTLTTEKEKKYFYEDVHIMYVGIKEMMNKYKLMKNIPLTSTGVVRKELKEFLKKQKKGKYSQLEKMRFDYLNSRPDAKLLLSLKIAFCGGITHSSIVDTNKLLHNIVSYDIISSYPFQMITHKFPFKFSKIETFSNNEMIQVIKDYKKNACLFKATFYNFRPIKNKKPISIISKSNTIEIVNSKYDNNGKILFADEVTLLMNNIDYANIMRFYDCDDIVIDKDYFWLANGSQYKRLNSGFIDFILQAYCNKTKLKGIEEYKAEYLMSKNIVNGLYGMCVQFPLNDIIEYDVSDCENPFKTFPIVEKLNKELKKHNKNELYNLTKNNDVITQLDEVLDELANAKHYNILLYQHGVWVTSYARYQLCTMIEKVHNNFIYCDTDSIKFYYDENCIKEFEKYNDKIINKLHKISEKENIDFEKFEPCDNKGEKHLIGLWDYEYTAQYFKTLGAKRYLVYKDNELSATVAGCKPDELANYLVSTNITEKDNYSTIKDNRKNIDEKTALQAFDKFHNNTILPSKFTTKKTHKTVLLPANYWIDVTDYNENTEKIMLGSFVLLEPCTFQMKLFYEYVKTMNELDLVYNSK